MATRTINLGTEIVKCQVINGHLFRLDDGSCIGDDTAEAFHITDEASLKWYMGKLLESDSAWSAADNSPEVIAARAVLENVKAIKDHEDQRRAGLIRRFSAQAEIVSRGLITKGKSFRTPVGTAQLSDVPRRVKMREGGEAARAAIQLAKAYRAKFGKECLRKVPASVEFMISKIGDNAADFIEAGLSKETEAGEKNLFAIAFSIEKPYEKFEIKTGIKKGK